MENFIFKTVPSASFKFVQTYLVSVANPAAQQRGI